MFPVASVARAAQQNISAQPMRAFATVTIVLTFFVNVPTACAEENQIEQLRWIEKANPTTAAEAALKKNDHRLLAVQGYP